MPVGDPVCVCFRGAPEPRAGVCLVKLSTACCLLSTLNSIDILNPKPYNTLNSKPYTVPAAAFFGGFVGLKAPGKASAYILTHHPQSPITGLEFEVLNFGF